MSPLHPMLEKQRKKIQREQRGWVLIAVGICLMHGAVIRVICVIQGGFRWNPYYGSTPPKSTWFGELHVTVLDQISWWLLMLCAWVLVAIACRLRGLVTFRGEGVLLLTVAFSLPLLSLSLAMCFYLASHYF